jgi:4-amino-4-deoxy-L-arabinose transferase-like glycosyltransferase
LTSFSWRSVLLIGAPFIAATALRLYILPTSRTPFEADEAIFLLMARHILHGERPLYFYGESYGAASDSYLIALFYRLIGETVATGRIVQTLEYFIGMLFTYLFSQRLMPRSRLGPLAVLWLMALPPLMVSVWTLPAVLYAVIPCLGGVLSYLGYRLLREDAELITRWILFGVLAGLAFWSFGILVVYLLPLFILFLWQFRWRRLPHYLLSGLAFFLGSLPWWVQAVDGLGVVFKSDNPTMLGASYAFRLLGFFTLLLPGFFGFREPWAPDILWPALAPAVLLFYLAAILYAIPAARRSDEQAPPIEPVGWVILGGQVLSWTILYFGTRFSFDPTGRYILPLYLPLFVAVGLLLERLWPWRRWAALGLLAAILAYNLATHVQAVQTVPPGMIAQTHPDLQFSNIWDQELIDFVAEHGGRGYTHHWISFKIAFLSQEQVILVSYLPYLPDLRWNPKDDRYPPYAAAVEASPERVYVTHREPNLEAYLQHAFDQRQVSYRIHDIGPYRVYYDFSRVVTPQEIGVGGPGATAE